MSWLFGILSKRNANANTLNLNEKFHSVKLKNIFVATGGNPETSFLKTTSLTVTAIAGVLITEENGKKKIVGKHDFYRHGVLAAEQLNGHFVYLDFSNNTLQIQTDTFGLRELYYINTEEKLIFSTRFDLLVRQLSAVNINIKEFASLWLTNFQLSHNSIVKEIKRLGPGGKLIFKAGKLKIANNKFEKNETGNAVENFKRTISSYVSVDSKQKISLALSGGIDCRVILAFLLNGKNQFRCHSIINEEYNDLTIAREICKTLNLPHTLISRQNESVENYENEILQFYKNIPPVIPLTQLLDFGIFGKDHLKNYLILDGGFGEFYRRQYLSKIYFRGYRKFNLQSVKQIKNILYAAKPAIFNAGIQNQMESFVEEYVRALITSFPQPENQNELAEILDYISLRFMLPGVYGAGQTILDQNFISFMPLTQQDSINLGMNIPLERKSGSKFFKQLIMENEKRLSEIDLVKNNLKNPFRLPNTMVMFRLLINKKLKLKENTDRYNVLLTSKNFILDLLGSKEITQSKYLNRNVNSRIVKEFFAGDLSKGIFVDWLLTFVLWSKANRI